MYVARIFPSTCAQVVSTNPIRASASYWLCRPSPLVMVAATYTSAANPAVGHDPSRSLTVGAGAMGDADGAAVTGPLGNGAGSGGDPNPVTPRTKAME